MSFNADIAMSILSSYEGDRSEKNCFHGNGKAVFKDGHVYVGSFVDGKMHGNGEFVWNDDIKYTGEFANNTLTGKGIYKFTDGSQYEGEVCNGLRHGVGCYQSANMPCCYDGEWRHSRRHGHGKLYYNETRESFYDGQWVDGMRHGIGFMKYESGNSYDGEWKNDQKTGHGTMLWSDSGQSYFGMWENNRPHGFGVFIWSHIAAANKPIYEQQGICNTYGAAAIVGFPASISSTTTTTPIPVYNNTVDFCRGVSIGNGAGHHSMTQPSSPVPPTIVSSYSTRHLLHSCSGPSLFLSHTSYNNEQCDEDSATNSHDNSNDNTCQTPSCNQFRPAAPHPTHFQSDNRYVGEFCKGLRHGKGQFCYADGSLYDGDWENNCKHGNGIYTFENGLMYVGRFEHDRMVDNIPQRPKSFFVPLQDILSDNELTEETIRVTEVLLRLNSELRAVYSYYMTRGMDQISAEVGQRISLGQIWDLLYDCRLVSVLCPRYEINKLFMREYKKDNSDFNVFILNQRSINDPAGIVFYRQFLAGLTYIAHKVFANDNSVPMLSMKLSKLLHSHIIARARSIGNEHADYDNSILGKFRLQLYSNDLQMLLGGYHNELYSLFNQCSSGNDHCFLKDILTELKKLGMLDNIFSANTALTVWARSFDWDDNDIDYLYYPAIVRFSLARHNIKLQAQRQAEELQKATEQDMLEQQQQQQQAEAMAKSQSKQARKIANTPTVDKNSSRNSEEKNEITPPQQEDNNNDKDIDTSHDNVIDEISADITDSVPLGVQLVQCTITDLSVIVYNLLTEFGFAPNSGYEFKSTVEEEEETNDTMDDNIVSTDIDESVH